MKKTISTLWLLLSISLFWILIFAGLILPSQIQISIPENYPQILVKTIPVDPNDLLRGEYVVLNYSFSRPNRWINEDEKTEFDQKFSDFFGYNDVENATENFHGKTVYISMRLQKANIYIPIDISFKKPQTGIFLRGEIYEKNSWKKEIRFGIEKFFVPQGQGKNLEKAQREKKLYARIAVDPHSGKSLLVGVEEVR